MRSKNILSIAAFAIAFSLSTVLAGFFITETYPATFEVVSYSSGPTCSKRHHNLHQSPLAREITAFINSDKANGRARDRKIFGAGVDFRPAFESSSFPKYAVAVEEYVDESSKLDASDLPQEFKTAWRNHINAWRDYTEFLNEMKSPSERRKMNTEELLSLDNEYSNEINQTWEEVLSLGATYGADVY
jgi:hypothetical protein